MSDNQFTFKLKQKSKELGFFECGIAKAECLTEEARKLESWLHKGLHGKMTYMENHFDKRIDPTLLVDGAKSVITLLFNYFPQNLEQITDVKISKYAWGNDYHEVIKEKLKLLLCWMQSEIGEIHGRGFVDSAPVLERAWAVRSGLGWVGKNGNVITRKQGSFFFIATIIVDFEINTDVTFDTNHCGTCTACIDACPTDAILPNKVIDGSSCISYFTIELKDAIIKTDKVWKDWAFGCDICQDVCPWNRFSIPSQEPNFLPKNPIKNYNSKDWLEITDEIFSQVMKNSPLKRAKLSGLKRNINFLLQNEAKRVD